jgi:hypothetical protein
LNTLVEIKTLFYNVRTFNATIQRPLVG